MGADRPDRIEPEYDRDGEWGKRICRGYGAKSEHGEGRVENSILGVTCSIRTAMMSWSTKNAEMMTQTMKKIINCGPRGASGARKDSAYDLRNHSSSTDVRFDL
jgi:hypothetical protein